MEKLKKKKFNSTDSNGMTIYSYKKMIDNQN